MIVGFNEGKKVSIQWWVRTIILSTSTPPPSSILAAHQAPVSGRGCVRRRIGEENSRRYS